MKHPFAHHKTPTMKSTLFRSYTTALLSLTLMFPSPVRAEGDDGKLCIIVFGAHPDDAQYKAGGTAAKWAKLGHHVKLVSVTNGDTGHWQAAGGSLAQRRLAEVKKVDALIGDKRDAEQRFKSFDPNHDGTLTEAGFVKAGKP